MKSIAIRVVTLACGLTAASFSVPASAAPMRPSIATPDQYRQEVRADITKTRTALDRHRPRVATSYTGIAETTLLNATQAKLYSSPASLSALERAHDNLKANKLDRASRQLRIAEDNLATG